MASILKISDGTTTVDFINDAAYRVSSWSPAVPTRRKGELGGRGPYEDVVEAMTISVSGSQTLTKLQTLQQLMDQAERWTRGEPEAAVLLHYKPTASSEELKTVILGPDGDAAMLELPGTYALGPATQMIEPVGLRFRRLGVWLGAEATYDSGTAQTMPVVETVAVPDLSAIGYPVMVRMEGVGQWSDHVQESYILLGSAPSTDVNDTRIRITGAIVHDLPAEGFTTVNDSSKKPANGSTVLRYTPPATTVKVSADWNVSFLDTDARRWGVFVSYRNNHATTSFRVKMALAGAGWIDFTPELIVPGGVSAPRYAFLGAVSGPGPLTRTNLWVTADAAAGSIDFDVIAYIALDAADTSRVIEMGVNGVNASLTGDDLIIDHRLLTRPTPAVYYDETGDVMMTYRTDATVFLKGVNVYAAWLACGGVYNPTHWRPSNSGGTVFTNKWYLTTRKMYVIPV